MGNFSINNSLRKANSDLRFSWAIIASIMEDIANSKKQLTEAQRLAFLKGREKRMANIEKKRLEKEEAEAVVDAPPKPKLKRQVNKIDPDPEPEPEPEPKVKSEPKPEPEPEPKDMVEPDIDSMVNKIMSRIDHQLGDTLMDRFMNAMKEQQAQPKPKRKSRSEEAAEKKPRKTKPKSKSEDNLVPPIASSFSWL